MAELDDALAQGVSKLLADALAAEGGGFTTGFVLIADFLNADGERCWSFASPDDQVLSLSIGLVEYARRYLGACADRRFREDDDW